MIQLNIQAMEVIKEDCNYRIVVERLCGYPITFRHWKRGDVVEIKVDDNFAKANGYQSATHFLENIQCFKEYLTRIGRVPEWVIISPKGEFYFRDISMLN